MSGELAGIRVVDLARLLPGPLATRHLAELGAEVLKVEGPAADGQDDECLVAPCRARHQLHRDGGRARTDRHGRRRARGAELPDRRPDGRDAGGCQRCVGGAAGGAAHRDGALCRHLDEPRGGRPDWAEQHWTRGLAVGSPASMALRSDLGALLAAQPLAHWTAVFEQVDACVTPVLRLDETLRHPVFSPSSLSTNR